MPSKNDTIRLQKALNREGLGPLVVDGSPGEKTKAALMGWYTRTKGFAQGIDVSKWNAEIDWAVVRDVGLEAFAYCKASDGYSTDPSFSRNYTGIKAAGLYRGAYCWFHPSLELTRQADKLFSLVGKLQPGDLPVWIDVERDDKGPDGQLGTSDDIKATDAAVELYADLIEERTGKRPLIYSYSYYLDDRNVEVPDCGIAIADYRSGPPTLPPGWDSWIFHQHTGDKGTEPGVNGPCDQVWFNGSVEALRAYAGL